jgi:phosphoribosylaminoimidazolecarboxamide formyltransferase/IMP cyclohydrolase
VKTLHGRVHGGILAQRDDPEAKAVMEAHGIDPIDVVAVNLYRFEKAAAKPGLSEEDVVENIDIGGPAMIRSAAKNYAHVTVVVDPADYDEVVSVLGADDATAQGELRRGLAAKAFAHTAAYDRAVATWFSRRLQPDAAVLGDRIVVIGDKVQELRYGENPHQQAAFYRSADHSGVSAARQLAGKELSYNNIVDLDAALALVAEFELPACVIIKHTNPCGTAVADTTVAAFRAALASDSMSAFGGIVAVNRRLDAETARAIAAADLFVEALIAPEFAPESVEALGGGRGGKNLRLMSLDGPPAPPQELQLRWVQGGFLAQTPDAPAHPPEMRVVTTREPSTEERDTLAFAWRVAKHVKSNAIVLAASSPEGALATVGVGAGQMSRAVDTAGPRARGSVLASDAFFPFPDGIEIAAAAGVTAIIQPGGSRGDERVIAAANQGGVAMVFAGVRHFRH